MVGNVDLTTSLLRVQRLREVELKRSRKAYPDTTDVHDG
jgi:hypothetical protein